MFSATTPNFRKQGECPSSQELLEFQTGDLPREKQQPIRVHVAACEFCSAEADFYSRYPQLRDESEPEPSEIPAPLLELAEALLRNRDTDPKVLDRLLKERKGLMRHNR